MRGFEHLMMHGGIDFDLLLFSDDCCQHIAGDPFASLRCCNSGHSTVSMPRQPGGKH